jgi:hypothetical protein
MSDERLAAIRDTVECEAVVEPDTVLELVAEVEALKSTVSYMRLMMLDNYKYAGEDG